MANDPKKMFEHDADLSKVYDYGKIDLEKKKQFVEKVFLRIRELLNQRPHFCLCTYEKVYMERRHNIIFNWNDRLNFYQFSFYFASFFKADLHRIRI